MSASASGQNINALLQSAAQEGSLSAASLKVLTNNNFDLGAQIQASFGTPFDQVTATDVFLFKALIDDSSSIEYAGNEQAVRDGTNGVIEALLKSKSRDGILVSTQFINGKVLNPWTPIDQAIKLDARNYRATGSTPLYDMSVAALGDVIAKTQEFMQNGVPVRTVTGIISDGHDQYSQRYSARDVKNLVDDMRKEEGTHIVAAVGIDDGGQTDFYEIFSGHSKSAVLNAINSGNLDDLAPIGGMGIHPKWVLVPSNDPSSIRRALNVLSQSAQRASQNAASYSQTAAGGFLASNP